MPQHLVQERSAPEQRPVARLAPTAKPLVLGPPVVSASASTRLDRPGLSNNAGPSTAAGPSRTMPRWKTSPTAPPKAIAPSSPIFLDSSSASWPSWSSRASRSVAKPPTPPPTGGGPSATEKGKGKRRATSADEEDEPRVEHRPAKHQVDDLPAAGSSSAPPVGPG
jgi:hypothetical protein